MSASTVSAEWRVPLQWLQRALVIAVGVALAWKTTRISFDLLRDGTVVEPIVYNGSFLAANYVDSGFIRRGLAGTVSLLLSHDLFTGTVRFQILSAIFLIVPLMILASRVFRGARGWMAGAFLLVFICYSPQAFRFWRNDVGRTDMAVLGFVSWAAVAMGAGRPFVAAAVLLAGSLVHETTIMFGLPLMVAIAWPRMGDLPFRRQVVLAGGALLAGLVAIAVVQWAVAPPPEEVRRAMLARVPPLSGDLFVDLRDCAIYMMTTGLRGLRTAMCYNVTYQAYGLMAVLGLVVLLVSALALLPQRSLVGFLLAVVAPYLALLLLANDIGRWITMGVACTWIISATAQADEGETLGPSRIAFGLVILGALYVVGASSVHTVTGSSERLAAWLGYAPPPPTGEWMTACDPAWRNP